MTRTPKKGELEGKLRFPFEWSNDPDLPGCCGGGTTLPYARSWLSLMGCAAPGKVYRLAQIVAAAALALEISASAAMATAGSRKFFKAHHERG
jgi:hydroxymethylglutaryl-CoA reductase (NADPH)